MTWRTISNFIPPQMPIVTTSSPTTRNFSGWATSAKPKSLTHFLRFDRQDRNCRVNQLAFSVFLLQRLNHPINLLIRIALHHHYQINHLFFLSHYPHHHWRHCHSSRRVEEITGDVIAFGGFWPQVIVRGNPPHLER